VRETPTVQPAVVTQQSFRDNARCTFNLFMTDQRRALIERLERFPRLADFFEAHEGVHSGNIRNELFVDRKVDATCRELLFGRNEISRFSLRWHGRYIRLGALPAKKTRNRYANIGDSGWHERDKLLVRRTGDFVLAAVDEVGRYCSNNFFLVIPHAVHPLDLHGLCALLNSRLMTTFFRMIEPRKGRVFAELKIKHMSVFPVPQLEQVKETAQLNDFGRRRTKIAARLAEGIIAPQRDQLEREAEQLDRWIDERVNDIFGIASEEITALAV